MFRNGDETRNYSRTLMKCQVLTTLIPPSRDLELQNVEIIVADISTFYMEASYDRIFSIEMFEVWSLNPTKFVLAGIMTFVFLLWNSI